jgi:hypothetical protein
VRGTRDRGGEVAEGGVFGGRGTGRRLVSFFVSDVKTDRKPLDEGERKQYMKK